MKTLGIKNSVIRKSMAKYSLFILTPMLLGAPVVQAQYWTGTQSSQEWGEASNWSHNAVPTVNHSIVVNAGMDSEALINGQNFSVKELKAGATITEGSDDGVVRIVNGGSLIVTDLISLGHDQSTTGYLYVSGAGSTFTASLGTTNIGMAGEGHIFVEDGAQFNVLNNNIFTGNNGQAGTSSFVVTGNGTQANIGELILSYVGNGNTSDHTTIFSVMDGAVVNAGLIDLAYVGKGIVTIDQGTVNATSVIAGYGINSENLTLITGENASLNINNQMEIGIEGLSSIKIEEGAYLKTVGNASLGVGENSQGTILVNGIGSKWDSLSDTYVGVRGKASIQLEDGAVFNVNGVGIGTSSTGKGAVSVSGGSIWTSTGIVTVAYDGRAAISITDGGKAHLNNVNTSVAVDSISTTLVSGNASELTVDGRLSIGLGGVSDLFVEKGAQVQAGNSRTGHYATGEGFLTVTDEGTIYNNSGEMVIGNEGKGTLTVTHSAHLSSADRIVLAGGASSEGMLNIGTGASAGIVEAPEIAGGNGNAIINFNYINDVDFGAKMTGRLTVNHNNIGATTLMGENSYAGITSVNSGTWQAGIANAFSANSDHIIANGAILDLNGLNQNVNSIDNAGMIRFGGASGTNLDLNDTYIGSGGVIEFNTVLGDDNSMTDHLTISGDTSGESYVSVNNTGGFGAPTDEGIKIIEVGGVSDGVFNLQGDYVHEGQQAVVGGAYAYKLYQGGVSTPTDGNWYLRSQLKPTEPVGPIDPVDPVEPEPLYQAGVPVYEAYPQALLGLNGVATLQQRIGNRVWSGNGNRVVAQGADAIGSPYAAPDEAGAAINGNGVWGRIEGSHNHMEPRFSTSDTNYNQNIFKMQAGIDGMLTETENGKLIGGFTVHYAHGKTKANSAHGDGDTSTDGYGLGGTLTWYSENGFYLDGQGQVTWYRSDLHSTTANTGLADNNHGFGYALSLEGGKRVAIDQAWSLTPQAQLTYSNVDFDAFTDTFGARVSLDRGESLEGRLGLTLDHENSWQNANGMLDRTHVYGIANLYYEFLQGTRVNVAESSFTSRNDRLWGGLGLGGSYNWNDDKYSIYGEGLVNTSLNNFGDSYSVKGNVGFRVKW